MDPLALRSLIESTASCTVETYMKTYAGIATFFRTKYGLSATDIALIGLPVDAGLTQRTGVRHGPRELRNQSCNVFEIPCLSVEAFTPRAEIARP